MATWIKICGITSKEDIDICIQSGVHALGFLLEVKNYKMKYMLKPKYAKELIEYASCKSSNIDTCLLIHLKDVNKIIKTLNFLKPSMIQIQKQSKLSINDVRVIRNEFPGLKIAKTFYIKDGANYNELLNEIKTYTNSGLIDYILLDSAIGGSGNTHDWSISKQIVKEISPFKTIIAGGLNPANIQNAIKETNPFGVDVMTGVSTESKNKDAAKVKEFVKNVKFK